jgi:hypothetical protein
MDQQETLRALLNGRRVRQINWAPGDYIYHWKQTWVADEQSGIPVYQPSAGVMYYNNGEKSEGLIAEEDLATVFSFDVAWELSEDMEDIHKEESV